MYSHCTRQASFFSLLVVALIVSSSMAAVAAAQGNTSLGTGALQNNTTASFADYGYVNDDDITVDDVKGWETGYYLVDISPREATLSSSAIACS